MGSFHICSLGRAYRLLELRIKNETAIPEALVPSGPQYVALKHATVPKLGKHADETISYKVACDMGRTALFRMEFPSQAKAATLDLTRPRGKPSRLRTVTKEVNARVDRWNIGLGTDQEGLLRNELNPALRIWIARQCFNRVSMVDEERQRATLCALCKSIMYRKRLEPGEIARIQDFGVITYIATTTRYIDDATERYNCCKFCSANRLHR
jgi:hypothetical protein